MFKLHNSLQHYAWGSKTALTELYGIENPQQQPMAELWMGAHSKSSSLVEINGERRTLREMIAADKSALLGEKVAARFGELPFLFKVLCAEQPLSIQVHPGKSAAAEGFARENAAGVPLDAPERNYKDANHKPELVYALTPFLAINGFRPFAEIIALLQPVAGAHPAIAHFLEQPDEASLAALFSSLLSLQHDEKKRALDILKATLHMQSGEPWQTMQNIAETYPDDSGLFSPLLLNVIELQPGEAMFLFAETPHAYLRGVALEVMANSDNVLRAGLTPKHIDLAELMANVKFTPRAADSLLTEPVLHDNMREFPVPVDDFAFAIHQLSATPVMLSQQSAAILFCIDGEAQLAGPQPLTLKAGESCFVAASESPVTVCGHGQLARVYNQPG
ncbi:mannose-6-phosphate isomerase [Pantoea alhagi]|uniref:mannose-6-phosphate isomerase n=1 Tax=Mixta sp. BE291 TaxID=3158787 RepID=UPI00285D7FC2|nr:mannose-6-phosphate isomerase [Pantoea alhagi]